MKLLWKILEQIFLFQNIESKGILSNLFYEASINLIPKSVQVTTKLQTSFFAEDLYTKHPQTEFRDRLRRQTSLSGFHPGDMDWFNLCQSINELLQTHIVKNRNHIIISVVLKGHLPKLTKLESCLEKTLTNTDHLRVVQWALGLWLSWVIIHDGFGFGWQSCLWIISAPVCNPSPVPQTTPINSLVG